MAKKESGRFYMAAFEMTVTSDGQTTVHRSEEVNRVLKDGEWVDVCSRTACRKTPATCRHTQTGRLYCHRCARAINEHNPGLVEIPPAPKRGKPDAK
jgi:hypothetical protein